MSLLAAATATGGCSWNSAETGGRRQIAARALINATGPWVGRALENFIQSDARAAIRLVKGTHIMTGRLYDHDRAYVFQNVDGRAVFAIPYESDFTLIGTTDKDYRGDPGNVSPDDTEIDYLSAAVSQYFRTPVTREAVRFVYSGMRPLSDDGATRRRKPPAIMSWISMVPRDRRRCFRSSGARSRPIDGSRRRRWRSFLPFSR